MFYDCIFQISRSSNNYQPIFPASKSKAFKYIWKIFSCSLLRYSSRAILPRTSGDRFIHKSLACPLFRFPSRAIFARSSGEWAMAASSLFSSASSSLSSAFSFSLSSSSIYYWNALYKFGNKRHFLHWLSSNSYYIIGKKWMLRMKITIDTIPIIPSSSASSSSSLLDSSSSNSLSSLSI